MITSQQDFNPLPWKRIETPITKDRVITKLNIHEISVIPNQMTIFDVLDDDAADS